MLRGQRHHGATTRDAPPVWATPAPSARRGPNGPRWAPRCRAGPWLRRRHGAPLSTRWRARRRRLPPPCSPRRRPQPSGRARTPPQTTPLSGCRPPCSAEAPRAARQRGPAAPPQRSAPWPQAPPPRATPWKQHGRGALPGGAACAGGPPPRAWPRPGRRRRDRPPAPGGALRPLPHRRARQGAKVSVRQAAPLRFAGSSPLFVPPPESPGRAKQPRASPFHTDRRSAGQYSQSPAPFGRGPHLRPEPPVPHLRRRAPPRA
mmetsp:Transcript_87580/g.276849  ORF Transcript_87580/g.276849 Transcript_87580/m.276849 type:complete len:261 (+) Transcript_87580:609-1391(+)